MLFYSYSSESSLWSITYMIFMEQSFSYQIFRLLLSQFLLRLSQLSRINVFPYMNLSFLKSQSKFDRIYLLFLQKYQQFLGCQIWAIYVDNEETLYLQTAYYCISVYVFSISFRAYFWIYFYNISILFLNYFMSFNFLITSTASSTYLITCLNGVLSNLSIRNVTSSIVKIFIAWSRWSFLQPEQSTLKDSGQYLFMHIYPLTGTLFPFFQVLLCFSQIKYDITYYIYLYS